MKLAQDVLRNHQVQQNALLMNIHLGDKLLAYNAHKDTNAMDTNHTYALEDFTQVQVNQSANLVQMEKIVHLEQKLVVGKENIQERLI